MQHLATNVTTANSKQTGFTLIEVLVVLIIVGMVSGILFQALERAYRLQDRFGLEIFKVQQGQMAADWYRQTVQGLHPDYPKGGSEFWGSSQEFSGLTSNPLSNEYGALTKITWKIRNNLKNGTSELHYLEGVREETVLSWRGNKAKFIYLDEKQAQYDSWPPPMSMTTQIPQLIELVAQDRGDTIVIVASTKGDVTQLPPPDIYE